MALYVGYTTRMKKHLFHWVFEPGISGFTVTARTEIAIGNLTLQQQTRRIDPMLF